VIRTLGIEPRTTTWKEAMIAISPCALRTHVFEFSTVYRPTAIFATSSFKTTSTHLFHFPRHLHKIMSSPVLPASKRRKVELNNGVRNSRQSARVSSDDILKEMHRVLLKHDVDMQMLAFLCDRLAESIPRYSEIIAFTVHKLLSSNTPRYQLHWIVHKLVNQGATIRKFKCHQCEKAVALDLTLLQLLCEAGLDLHTHLANFAGSVKIAKFMLENGAHFDTIAPFENRRVRVFAATSYILPAIPCMPKVCCNIIAEYY
jgi:hypothetical protein